ncbi:MAG: hypothetical protein ACE5E0_05625 [Terriglobia bacterium]
MGKKSVGNGILSQNLESAVFLVSSLTEFVIAPGMKMEKDSLVSLGPERQLGIW